MKRLCVLLLLVVGCKEEDLFTPEGDELQVPTGTPEFPPGSVDLASTWTELPSGRGFDYDVVWRQTDSGGDFLSGGDIIERRSYENRSQMSGEEWLDVSGMRMGRPLAMRLRRASNGWIYIAEGSEWTPLWPTEIREGNTWTTYANWYLEGGRFDATYRVVSMDAVANGVGGAVHLNASFSDGGFTGSWDVYWVNDGPMTESRSVTEPTGVTWSYETIRRPSL